MGLQIIIGQTESRAVKECERWDVVWLKVKLKDSLPAATLLSLHFPYTHKTAVNILRLQPQLQLQMRLAKWSRSMNKNKDNCDIINTWKYSNNSQDVEWTDIEWNLWKDTMSQDDELMKYLSKEVLFKKWWISDWVRTSKGNSYNSSSSTTPSAPSFLPFFLDCITFTMKFLKKYFPLREKNILNVFLKWRKSL